MDCDVAVLGGGPGRLHRCDPRGPAGREGRLHRAGAGARRHVPARRLHPDEGVGADGVRAQGGARVVREVRRQRRRARSSTSDVANQWKDGVVKQMTGGVAIALQGERRRVGQGQGPLQGREHDRRRGRRGRHASSRRSSRPARSRFVRRSRGSTRRAASTRRACSRRARCRDDSSSSAAGSSASSSPRSSSASGAR